MDTIGIKGVTWTAVDYSLHHNANAGHSSYQSPVHQQCLLRIFIPALSSAKSPTATLKQLDDPSLNIDLVSINDHKRNDKQICGTYEQDFPSSRKHHLFATL